VCGVSQIINHGSFWLSTVNHLGQRL